MTDAVPVETLPEQCIPAPGSPVPQQANQQRLQERRAAGNAVKAELKRFVHPACARLHQKKLRKVRTVYNTRHEALSDDFDALLGRCKELREQKQQVEAELRSVSAQLQNKKQVLELAQAKKKTLTERRLLEVIDKISSNMKENMTTRERKSHIHKLVDPAVLSQQRLTNTVAKKFGLTNKAVSTKDKGFPNRTKDMEDLRAHILSYVEDPAVSWLCAGKKEKVTLFAKDEADGVKKVKQQRVLLMDVKDIHRQYNSSVEGKYQCEYNKFNGVIKQCKWIKRLKPYKLDCCLCKTHQNYALKLKAMNAYASFLPIVPDTLFLNYTKEQLNLMLRDEGTYNENYRYSDLPAEITFKRWEMTPVPVGKPAPDGTVVKVNKLRPVTKVLTKDDFIKEIIHDYDIVRDHADRAKHQHCTVREQRERLGEKECTVQMDFAQNWLVGFGEGGEIQSVFFNKDGITVHPVVIHLKRNGLVVKKSLCYVTDDRKHDAGAIFEILRLICKYIRRHFKGITMVHYWTDSPSSQYRNISIYSLVCRHFDLFKLDATWNYFETNHGKGECEK